MARDRFGIKPLYLAETPNSIRFASTLPALLKAGDIDTSIDRHAFAQLPVVPTPWCSPPRTIIKGVRKLAPATIRIVEANGERKDHVYWTRPNGAIPNIRACRSIELARSRAGIAAHRVKRRMVADVPVGVLFVGRVVDSLDHRRAARRTGPAGADDFSVGFEEGHGREG